MEETKQVNLPVNKALYGAYKLVMKRQRLVDGSTIKRNLRAVMEQHMQRVVERDIAKMKARNAK